MGMLVNIFWHSEEIGHVCCSLLAHFPAHVFHVFLHVLSQHEGQACFVHVLFHTLLHVTGPGDMFS